MGFKNHRPSDRGAGLANFTSLGSSGNFLGKFSNGMFCFFGFFWGALLGLVSLGLVWFGFLFGCTVLKLGSAVRRKSSKQKLPQTVALANGKHGATNRLLFVVG